MYPPWTHSGGPASCCAPSTHLYTGFLCLLADPLGFEDPPPGIPVAARNRCWLDIVAVTSCFLHCGSPTPYPLPPPLTPARACSTPSSVGSATTVDMSGLLTSLCLFCRFGFSLLRPQGCCPHPTLPVVVPKCLACLVLQTWSAMAWSPSLVYMSHPPGNMLMLWPPSLQTVIMEFQVR
jgi:hypothetical protein